MLNKRQSFLSILLIISLLFAGCAVKKMTKQAEQFEGAGMFKEASEMYYQALQKKPGKAELKIALKRTGQIYYEDLASEIKNSFNRGEYKETVYYYMEASDMISKYSRTGINIKSDPASERYYNDAKDYYLDDRYNIGLKHITDQEYDDAKSVFNEIFKIDPDYKDTRSYLNEATFEPIYRQGNQYYIDGRYMDAYNNWESIYQREKNYKDTRDRMDQALNERYKEGSLWLMDENFNDAAKALGDVYGANPNFKDVKSQYIEARNEPIYRKAKNDMSQGKCRTAFFDFEKIIDDAGTYKDAKNLKGQALDCAEYPVAVFSQNPRQYNSEAGRFEDATIKSLVNKNNIFLKVFDLTSLNSKLESRLMSNAGNIDEATLSALSRDHNIKAILILTYDNFKKNSGKLEKNEMTGFERIVTKSTEGETGFYDKRITYNEYKQKNEISLTVHYKLISTSSGEILLSDTYSGSKKDQINYATYDGDNTQVYPAKSVRGAWNIDESGYRSLQSLLRSNKEISSIESLQKTMFNELSDDIARDINNFNPEK